jgi:hypothetical protein
VEAEILEQDDTPRVGRNRLVRLRTHAVRRERDGSSQQGSEMIGDGLERELRIGFALRPSQMRRQNHRRAVIERISNRRQRRADARVIANLPVLDRHVEIDAHEDAPPVEPQILNTLHSPFPAM